MMDTATVPTGNVGAAPGPLLSVAGISLAFGGIRALDDVSFDVSPGQVAGLIGPNGAGKTTLFNCLSRLYVPDSGDILFDGRSILREPQHRIPRIGIGRTFQNVALFDSLTVLDNVMVGGHSICHTGFFSNAIRLPRVHREESDLYEIARAKIVFMDLERYIDHEVGGLPFPVRKRVELARALVSRPRLLLLDEPAAGLNHEELETLKRQIRLIRDEEQVTVLLVEHHMGLVMSTSDKVVAIDFGRKIAEGTPAEVQNDPEVIRAYLGGDT